MADIIKTHCSSCGTGFSTAVNDPEKVTSLCCPVCAEYVPIEWDDDDNDESDQIPA